MTVAGRSTAFVEIDSLSKEFVTDAGTVHALSDVTVDLGEGDVVCVLGPSGCGKSTLLRIVAGLSPPSSGSVSIGDQTITEPYTDVGIVFQQDLLLEWRSTIDNVLMQFALRGVSTKPHAERARELLELVGVGEFERHYPRQLSGGMRQRVSICRALAHDPPLLLMDEPFGALDALTREQVTLDLARIAETTQKTVLFITHSIDEAVFLGDRVLVMSPRPGRVIADVSIELERPRRGPVKETREFGTYTHELRAILASEGVVSA